MQSEEIMNIKAIDKQSRRKLKVISTKLLSNATNRIKQNQVAFHAGGHHHIDAV